MGFLEIHFGIDSGIIQKDLEEIGIGAPPTIPHSSPHGGKLPALSSFSPHNYRDRLLFKVVEEGL